MIFDCYLKLSIKLLLIFIGLIVKNNKQKMSSSSGSDSDSSKDKKDKKDKKDTKKDTKKVKTKTVVSTPNYYSKRFEGLFNNKKNSDVTVKFEGSGDVYSAHKVVLAAQSDGKFYFLTFN
jgi:hypothetical protein